MEDNNWSETKQRLMTRWPGLTDSELDVTKGEREAILSVLEGRLGYARANAEGDLDRVLAGAAEPPRDIADEKQHTGTTMPAGRPT